MGAPRPGTSFLLFFICSPGFAKDKEIPIGVSAAFKGASEFLGIELYGGSMAYFDEVN
jgi:hypothetical protein